ncbi:MAG: tetratricopeptide repeat protein [Planctomycetota bacterium]
MTANSHEARPTARGAFQPFRACLRTGSICAVAGLLLAPLGCKSMTERQRIEQERVAAETEAAEAERRTAEARVAELDAEEAELRRQAQEITDREDRRTKLATAIERLEANAPADALAILEELLAEYPEPAPDAEGTPTPATFGDEPEPAAGVVPEPVKKLEPQERAGILIVYGEALAGEDRHGEAIEAFRKARSLDPKSKIARMNLGSLLFGQEQFAEALEEWRHVLDDGYPGSELLFQIGMARWEVAKENDDAMLREAAKGAIRSALVGLADSPQVQHWAALAEFETERYAEALLLFEGLLAKQPSHFEYRVAAAQCCEALGKVDEAINHYELAARLQAPTPAQCAELARLYEQRNLPQMAAEWLLRAYGDEPATSTADAASRLFLGTLLARSSRFEQAEGWLRSVQPTDKAQYAEALTWLSDGLLAKSRATDALASLNLLRAVRPEDAHAHLSAGDILRQLERWDESVAAYNDARRSSELEPEALAGIAEVYYQTNRLEEAVSKYREALEKAPDNRRFRVYLEQIQTELDDQKNGAARDTTAAGNLEGSRR